MVSPSISSPPKVPPLSYADRAKKAQNIRSPVSLQPHRIAVHTVPSATSETSTPFLTSPSKPASNPTNVDNAPDFPAVLTSTFSSHPPMSPTATSTALTNGVKHSSNDLAEKALSIVAAHTAPPQKSPVVNVWNVRKEQMAAARSPATASSQMSTSQSMPLPQKSVLPSNQSKTSPKSPQDSAPNYAHGPSASAATNGVVAPPPVEYDPFVVRIFTKPTRVQIPSLPPSVDTDNWPEVGKLSTASISNVAIPEQAPNLAPSSREENQSSSGSGNDPLSAGVSRKSEKTKWIPIPAEELQATADALTKAERRQNQSRKGSQHTQQQRSNPRHSHGSASASGSTQTQSRLHSASQSASQSRIQSRSGSSQSSPRFPRRKLPGDESIVAGVSGYAAPNRSSAGRSPGTTSPQHAQYQLPPSQQPSLNADDPAASAAQPLGFYGQGVSAPSVPYYPPTLHQPSAYLRPSPHHPHSGYLSGQSTPPLPAAPYQPVYYIPFPPQPYVYWNGHSRSNPGSGHHSPAYPPPSHTQGAAVIPSHLPQYMHVHHQPHHPHAPRRRSETSPVLGMRPPPPHQSQPVGGYNVPLAGAGTDGATGIGERPVVFGSIGVPGASKCPSPAPLLDDDQRSADEEKPFTTFSIGVGPGDAGPSRVRSRTVSSKARSRTATLSDEGSETKSSVGADPIEETKVIDLTDPQDSKWEFGTVAAAPGLSDDPAAVRVGSDGVSLDEGGAAASGYDQLPPVLTSIAGFGSPLQPPRVLDHSPLQPPQVLGTRSGSGSPPTQVTTSQGPRVDDEFEVKDFGYGFGPASGTGYAETITRAERAQRQREHELELEREKVERANREAFEREALAREKEAKDLAKGTAELEPDKAVRDTDVASRPRRGSYYGGHERGSSGFGGRRGRGANGFGRGYGRRGGGGFQQHSRHAPPFSVTPPQTRFQPLIPTAEQLNGIYAQPRPLTTYIPTGYEAYPQPLPPLNTTATAQVIPPVPVPISPISFPLDPTRYYLLGQLEYYLSPQNMAQDFFLRQRMDSKGWVPISLIASFNRVRRLTMDIGLVRDVLVLSSVVQVRGDWVRMREWEKFILPGAAASPVESQEQGHEVQLNHVQENVGGMPIEGDVVTDMPVNDVEEGDADVDGGFEDDDEEDVVFVMDSEVAGSGLTWSPEKQT